MLNYLRYVGILLLGLFLGWLIFGMPDNSSETEAEEHMHTSSESNEVWTCSMHPQIRKPNPGACPICGMDLIPMEDQNGQDPSTVFSMSENATKIAQIQTTVIGSDTTSNQGISIAGKIQADETRSSSIVAHFPGRIEELYVAFKGQQVNKGQKIALIYAPELIAAQKELLEAKKIKSTQPALFNAAYQKLQNWKIDKAFIDTILEQEKIVQNFPVYAQYTGVIQLKKVAIGDYVSEGEILFDLQNLNSLWAVFDVYESDLKAISVGDQVSFSTPGYPDQEFNATIDFIDPVIDPNTRTIPVRASITNKYGKLKPEMFINGQVNHVSNSSQELVVPKSAVLWTGKRSVVYLQLPGLDVPTFEYREVVIGETIDQAYRVISGLSAGDEVVTNGAFVLDAAAQLNNQSSMMNQHLLENSEKNPGSIDSLPVIAAPPLFKKQLIPLIDQYIMIKNALVESDHEQVSKSSEKLLSLFQAVDTKELNTEAIDVWKKQSRIMEQIQKPLTSDSLSKQRQAFEDLSSAVEQLIKRFDIDNKRYYLQKCPMANDRQGAKWISTESKIRNPYFGDRMLGCGSTIEIIGQ